MLSMGEGYILIYHISLQVVSFMTTLLQTIPIINFVMGFLDPFPNHEICYGQLEIHPLSSQMIEETWTPVTIEAGYFVMRGCFPRVDILLHIVTEATKRRAF